MKLICVGGDPAELLPEQALPDGASVESFRRGAEALAYLEKNPCDAALVAAPLPDTDAFGLVRRLRGQFPRLNVIFIADDAEHAVEAFALRVSGYVLRPVRAPDMRRELSELRFPAAREKRLRLHCFGNFEVYVGAEPLRFNRSKTKEILAYLTDRQGSACTMGELIAILWENKPVNASMRSNLRNMIHDLRKTLAGAGVEDAIRKTRNEISLVTENVECDYFDFLRRRPGADRLYRGEYMAQYTWAELTTGMLISETLRRAPEGAVR